MAKKAKSNSIIAHADKQIEKYFHFSDPTEFVIFLVWGLFVVAFLITMVK